MGERSENFINIKKDTQVPTGGVLLNANGSIHRVKTSGSTFMIGYTKLTNRGYNYTISTCCTDHLTCLHFLHE